MKIIGNLLSIALGFILPTPLVYAQPLSADRNLFEPQLDRDFSILSKETINFQEINFAPFLFFPESYKDFTIQNNVNEEAKSPQIDCHQKSDSTELFTNKIIIESVSGTESTIAIPQFKTEEKPKTEKSLKIDSFDLEKTERSLPTIEEVARNHQLAKGDRFSKNIQEELPMMRDAEVLGYVRGIGNKLASVAGRDEFEYEFHIIMDDRLNAFALPGGKIFINAGAILESNSEAELAGLLAHELAHTVLSHGFQLMAQGSLTANVTQYIPYVGALTSDLLVFSYSREMEQQADLFGTRLLAASNYAADGVRNLMVTLDEQNNYDVPAWLSTHPETSDRVDYIEELIVRQKLNRYTYEGVIRHREIKRRVTQLLAEYEKEQEAKEKED